MAMRRALFMLLLVYSIRAEYTINVYRGTKNIALENFGVVERGQLEVGADYSLEIKSNNLSHDYLIESCTVVETGEQIIGPPGCLRCTNVFINMVESSGYYGVGIQKSSIIHFRPNRPDMSFQCTLQEHPGGTMDRACERRNGGLAVFPIPLSTLYLYWGTGGLPWWAWLLIILLLLLLLCCCLALLAFLFLKWKKRKGAVAAKTEKTVIAHTDVRPMCVVSGTQTSNFDRTSINRMALENGSETLVMDRAASKQSDIECARMGASADEKVEVFSGHAGVYNVRNGSTHRYEKNPNITRTRHESELFEEVDRHSYFNQGYEPEAHRRSVNCVEGYDEVVRYTTDREIGEYDHVEREIETNHSTRFYNEPPSTRYYDRRHHSIPV